MLCCVLRCCAVLCCAVLCCAGTRDVTAALRRRHAAEPGSLWASNLQRPSHSRRLSTGLQEWVGWLLRGMATIQQYSEIGFDLKRATFTCGRVAAADLK